MDFFANKNNSAYFCLSCYFVPYYDYSFSYKDGVFHHIYTLNEPEKDDCPRIELFETTKFYVLDVVWEQ